MVIDPVADYQGTIISKTGICPEKNETVLDAGCGRGDNAVLFARTAKSVIGIDLDPWPEWRENRIKNLIFKQANIEKIPFDDQYFDIVFIKDTLHHVNKPVTVLKEIHRITKNGGRIYIVEANRYNPVFYIHMTLMKGHNHFTYNKFTHLVRTTFPSAVFKTAETRVYPLSNNYLTRIVHKLENIIEQVPILKRFCTYNIAVISDKSQ